MMKELYDRLLWLYGARTILIIGTILFVSTCSPIFKTEITGSWAKTENQARHFDRIMVLGLSDNVPARAQVEQAIVQRMAQEGFQVVQGMTLISPLDLKDYNGDRQKAKRVFEEHSVDSIIVISVRDVKEKVRYVPGTVIYTPAAYGYGELYPYWYGTYNQVYMPGYFKESREIFLESNLYAIATEELLWSAQSKSENPSSISELARSYAEVLVEDLKAKNVFVP